VAATADTGTTTGAVVCSLPLAEPELQAVAAAAMTINE